MDAFAAARAIAREKRAAALQEAGGDEAAAALLAAAARLTGLSFCGVSDDDGCLRGAEAVLDRDLNAIFYKRSTSQRDAHAQLAHELGHFWLDGEPADCDRSAFELQSEEAVPLGATRAESYSPKERRECQANIFARTFLLPPESARELFRAGATASAIAAELDLAEALVIEQLTRGTLLPSEAPPEATPAGAIPPLDPFQAAAATIQTGPLLLEAGPGTGKTRTLVARVEHLLARGVTPSEILVLTFSNKAAEELRERIARSAPAAAAQIWAGTFHAFGLELLRQYGHLIGLPADPKLTDTNAALGVLEDLLPTLPLDHYLVLHEPTQGLVDILKAISRAKDELVDPAGYRALGEAMPAADRDAQIACEKALEIADLYAAYDAALAVAGRLDFGGLIMRCCELLKAHPSVSASLAARWPQILVDEFQDVNRASAVLLKHLAGDGEGLWVVGDARQSIYRFRGASPDNIAFFDREYPTSQTLALGINYRSRAPIVAAFAHFGQQMQAGSHTLARWEAHSGAGAPIAFHIANSLESEAQGLAEAIAAARSAGIAYRDQAILCRSHTGLARYAAILETCGIPVLYLGDIFERPEVRDLLSCLSLLAEPASSGLVRLAAFPAYAIPLADLRVILSAAAKAETSSYAALVAFDASTLSVPGALGLERLRSELAGLDPRRSAWHALTDYLFNRSRWLEPLLADTSIAGAQQRLALFQLLQSAQAYARSEPRGGVCGFLDWVRRLELLGDERQLRVPPVAAANLDAVRLMTVHASKGLEFEAVYLPGLATGQFPGSRRYDPCPPPPGLARRTPDEVRLEEEECLLFVAMSRARDRLMLSRATHYGPPRKPSSFLNQLATLLPRRPDAPPDWVFAPLSAPDTRGVAACAATLEVHRVEDLDQYKRCPRAYLYQRILRLNGGRDDNGYVRFHRALYGVIRDLAAHAAGPDPRQSAFAALDDNWMRIGPAGHPFEALYRRQADLVLNRAMGHWLSGGVETADWHIDAGSARIAVSPDFVETRGGIHQVLRLRTGRAPKTPPDDDIYALYHVAAAALKPAAIGAHFLGCDTRVEVPMSDRVVANRLAKYCAAIEGIAAGAFPPRPDERSCPRCPQYFVCPGPIA